MTQDIEPELISQKLQEGLVDWNPNPLIPKPFQKSVQSKALTEAIAAIASFARAPLEEMLRSQQVQIEQLQAAVARLEQMVGK